LQRNAQRLSRIAGIKRTPGEDVGALGALVLEKPVATFRDMRQFPIRNTEARHALSRDIEKCCSSLKRQ
jgi:hypothetical protein